ncbi:MAG: FmdE family protein [Candidatus Electrothrix aestuarii]|uniref:FmdE family protein n=1 Tax=Candidatus Electrothrix aestuarii TaxID=3062594 RepID=A0AAU8LZR7_9BACT|nr:FmdE family protein [Candidatus Electrothrix aestuarii]
MSEEKENWKRCVAFHGHTCPGLAIGYRAALAAQARLQAQFSPDEEMVCVTENDACGVDAIQVLTGCSIGKGNLIYRDTGKQAFSFYSRKDGRKLRVMFKLQGTGHSQADREAFQEKILNAPDEELFNFTEPADLPPGKARIFTSIVCEECGEAAPEHKIRLNQGKKLCLGCFPDYSRGW